MSWTNYHNHSHYDDGKDTIENHVIAAIEKQVVSMGFSGHCPVPFENKWCIKKEDLDNYFRDISLVQEKFKDQIQIYKGLEIDYIPGLISPNDQWIQNLNLDYTIGSVHFVGKYENGLPGEADSTHTKFLHGLEHIYKGNIELLVKDFYALNREMVLDARPDIIGHIDKIKMQNHGLWDENSLWYQNEILNTLEVVKSAGTIIEINTRGIYKKLSTETYPGQWMLRHIHQMNIPIHINSDAHVPREITNNFQETLELVLSIGFKELKVLLDDEWVSVKIDKKGLMI